MSIKSKVLAAAATLTLVGGVASVGAFTAGSASAATPSCGGSCINIFSKQFDNSANHHHPNFVLDVLSQGATAGQPVILFRTSGSDPAEDFTIAYHGQVSDFVAAGLVGKAVALHYGGGACITPETDGDGGIVSPTCDALSPNEPAFEIEYSPFGVQSGLCVGTATTAIQGEGVTLQPCGVSSKTVWILDTFDLSFPAFLHGFFPAINGSDTNFSHPFVLSYPSNGFPTDIPRPQLKVTNLTGFSNGIGPIVGTVINTQLWSAFFGIVH
jgi:hypothetical protein